MKHNYNVCKTFRIFSVQTGNDFEGVGNAHIRRRIRRDRVDSFICVCDNQVLTATVTKSKAFEWVLSRPCLPVLNQSFRFLLYHFISDRANDVAISDLHLLDGVSGRRVTHARQNVVCDGRKFVCQFDQSFRHFSNVGFLVLIFKVLPQFG